MKTEHASKKTIEIVIAKDQIRSALFFPKEFRSCITGLSWFGHKRTEEQELPCGSCVQSDEKHFWGYLTDSIQASSWYGGSLIQKVKHLSSVHKILGPRIKNGANR